MTLYEDYYTQYRAAITQSRLKNKTGNGKVEYIVPDYLWITMKFFEDRKIIPSITDDDIVQAEILRLVEANETDMLNAIIKSMEAFDTFIKEKDL